jgi:hypothetical protein
MRVALLGLLLGCGGKHEHPTRPAAPSRTFRMGFSAIPPRPDFNLTLAAIDLWTQRADAAILHFDPPWDTLLKGAPVDSAVILVHKPLVDYYRAKGLMVVVTLDATNGLDRSAESPGLVAGDAIWPSPPSSRLPQLRGRGGRSSTHVFRARRGNQPDPRRGPPAIYAAVVEPPTAPPPIHDSQVVLDVSVQVETAGQLAEAAPTGDRHRSGGFPGSSGDRGSSYPYLGGFTGPEEVPPTLLASHHANDGGGGRMGIGGRTRHVSPQKQARYIRRQMQLPEARALAFQLTFTDLDPAYFPRPILPLFATLGLVANLAPGWLFSVGQRLRAPRTLKP